MNYGFVNTRVPVNLRAVSRAPGQLTLLWDMPDSNGVFRGWNVRRDGTDTGGYGEYEAFTQNREFTFLSLHPGTDYTLTVSSVTYAGIESEEVSITGTVQGTAPTTTTTTTTAPETTTTTTTTTTTPPPPSAGRFADDNGDVHEANIEFIVAAGITSGCSPADSRLYCPYTSVTRGQMATFLSRAAGLPASSTDHFGDDGGDVHEDNINRVAAAGLTNGWVSDGCGDGRYCPTKALTRAEMATMVARAFGVPAVDGGSFSDLDAMGVHAPSINALAGAGVVRGCGDSRYCPGGLTTRAAMATILANAIRLP